jgi:hypothetical protein
MSNWETITTQVGRGSGVAVAWRRKTSQTFAMVVSLSKTTTADMGLAAPAKGAPPVRLVAQRDRMAGKLRLFLATTEPREHSRACTFKQGGATMFVPLDDVKLAENKPAQEVPFEWDGQYLVLKLPAWACPPIKVATAPPKRAAA